eukprot:scaffold2995_cov135-Skeletonema_menzelii.AAC.3
MHHHGHGVEKDEKKTVYHLEEAAIGGHPVARHNLAYIEERRGKMDRAVKHMIIAANMGYDISLKALKNMYRDGLVSRRMTLHQLFAPIRLPLKQRKVHRGRRQKQFIAWQMEYK